MVNNKMVDIAGLSRYHENLKNVLLDNIPKIIESIRNLNHLANISIYPLTYSFNFNDEYLIDFYKNINDSFKNISNQYKLNFLEK